MRSDLLEVPPINLGRSRPREDRHFQMEQPTLKVINLLCYCGEALGKATFEGVCIIKPAYTDEISHHPYRRSYASRTLRSSREPP
jgi:hypothetical protein